ARLRRPGRLAARGRGPADLRLRGPDRLQDPALGSGPGVPAATGPAGRLRPGRDGTGPPRVHPHRDRVRQAGLRRPGGLVRRPRVHRRADGRPAGPGLRGPAAAPGRAGGRRRPDPRRAAGTGRPAAPAAVLRPGGRPARGRTPAPASRPRRPWGSAAAATPATWTPPTAGATWCRPRPAGPG